MIINYQYYYISSSYLMLKKKLENMKNNWKLKRMIQMISKINKYYLFKRFYYFLNLWSMSFNIINNTYISSSFVIFWFNIVHFKFLYNYIIEIQYSNSIRIFSCLFRNIRNNAQLTHFLVLWTYRKCDFCCILF